MLTGYRDVYVLCMVCLLMTSRARVMVPLCCVRVCLPVCLMLRAALGDQPPHLSLCRALCHRRCLV